MAVMIKGMNKPMNCGSCELSTYVMEEQCICPRLKRNVGIFQIPPKDCPITEVVRCKDCKHFVYGGCSKLHLVVADDSFCSDGERGEE